MKYIKKYIFKENVMDGTDYALKKSHHYSVIEKNFLEESQDEV